MGTSPPLQTAPVPIRGFALVADDDAGVRNLVVAWLRKFDVECICASDGEQALALVREHGARLDCIVLDVMMPKLDGFQVLEELGRDPAGQLLPVLLLTAHAKEEDDVVRAAEFGAIEHLTKPFSGKVLVAKVRGAITRRRRERDLRAALAVAEASASIDPLTRVFNRQHLDRRLREEAAHATRHNRPLSIVMLDLDHFKHVNDTYGHVEGDRVLRHAASVLGGSLRQDDAAFRFGGEEFVLLLRDCTASAAALVAYRLRLAFHASPLALGDAPNEPRTITFSAGIASAEEGNGFNTVSLLERADAALYRAKKGGRDRTEAEPLGEVSEIKWVDPNSRRPALAPPFLNDEKR